MSPIELSWTAKNGDEYFFTEGTVHTVQDVYKVASKNNAHTQFWCQHSSVRSTHSLPAKDVDGLLVIGASQDHSLGFHHMTIFKDQGDIKDILVK